MSLSKQNEKKLALALACDLLDKHFSHTEEYAYEENVVRGFIVDVLDLRHPVYGKGLSKWSYLYNATYIPSCCAGECENFDLDALGYIDITTEQGNTYTYPIDVISDHIWEAW